MASTPRCKATHALRCPAAIEQDFIGATLCECVTIKKFLMAGGYGRGWAGELLHPETKEKHTVFVKTLGVQQSDAKTAKARDDEGKARIEAAVYTHRWFPPAVDQVCVCVFFLPSFLSPSPFSTGLLCYAVPWWVALRVAVDCLEWFYVSFKPSSTCWVWIGIVAGQRGDRALTHCSHTAPPHPTLAAGNGDPTALQRPLRQPQDWL